MSDFISLYDHLGHAAGRVLGKQVAEYAALKKIPHEIRHVSNPKYTGEVTLYPIEFLDEYFKSQSVIGTNR
jgi:hypothetical protein